MNAAIRLSSILVLLALAGRPVAAQGLFEPRGHEAPIGPVPFQHTVSGVALSTPISAFVVLKADAETLQIDARVMVDLADLQRQAGALVDTVPLPTDTCARRAPDNLVARIWGKQLTVAGEVATLELHGDADVWACTNSLPCSKFENFRLVFFDCNPPLNKQVLNQPFSARLPMRLVVAGPQTVAVELDPPQVDLGGQLGGVTGTVLRIAGVDLSKPLKAALDRAVQPERLRVLLRDDRLQLRPVITRAAFADNGGTLAAAIELKSTFDARTLAALLQMLDPAALPRR